MLDFYYQLFLSITIYMHTHRHKNIVIYTNTYVAMKLARWVSMYVLRTTTLKYS